MTRSVLVTGTAGFIGGHVATGLHAAGWTVTGVDQNPAATAWPWESITVDAADPAVLARIAGGEFAVVVHQAAVSDTLAADDERLRWANATVPLRLARACTDSGTRLVYASSGSVYGVVPHGASSRESDTEDRGRCSGPLNCYAKSKLVLDQSMLRRAAVFGLDCVGLRYTNVFGPGEESKSSMASILWQIVTAVAARRPVRLFDDTLTAARDYLPVQVLVSTLVRLLDTPQVAGVYNLGSGTAIRFETLLGWCTEWAGAPVPLVGVPNPIRDCYQYWTCADMRRLRAALPGLEPVDTEVIHRYARDLFDHARAETFGVGELVKSL
ncbi:MULTISPECIES: NAD-dependent epimerase/dehydratase family protein [Nocardia]|uniref:ADP-L-glycero-D-manno-heptose 6-epimerase n=1 Tax=Nocardia puris TaxID=208602 RepID=A0A366D364_9NOCA|nr:MULTISPECIES: NAD-dependent epimerase/dehydratase family protein [Nocardia]RBO84507.1 ADP-L-glycero-D-manno-heptose 6-epimerase [Nocardia puris]